ncbi:MAG: TetR/AcrR family transcriptional regulator [Actinobacteria bacterium]|nr:TetR/AcrR family transcriptional regulator [Actinomycetota bacterium]
MSGLRERKKQQTRIDIVRSAEALFAERGLQEPTMEEIAVAAEVAVATLYNYFGSKLAIQMAVFEAETAGIVAGGAAVVADPGDDPEAAVERLFDAYLDGFFAIDRSLLLDVFRAGFSSTEMLPGLVSLDLLLLQQLGEMLGAFAGRGLVASEGIEDASLLLYSCLVTVLLSFLTVEAILPGDARDQVRRLVAAAFGGLRRAGS